MGRASRTIGTGPRAYVDEVAIARQVKATQPTRWRAYRRALLVAAIGGMVVAVFLGGALYAPHRLLTIPLVFVLIALPICEGLRNHQVIAAVEAAQHAAAYRPLMGAIALADTAATPAEHAAAAARLGAVSAYYPEERQYLFERAELHSGLSRGHGGTP